MRSLVRLPGASPVRRREFLSYRLAVRSQHPRVVVLAFTGNPGISPAACIKEATADYRLSDILSAYRVALQAMGSFATRSGSRVVLSATPARNPDVPEGWVDQSQHGYNGDPAFNTMMSELASSQGWTYDTGGAAAISGPGLGWTLFLPCPSATEVGCVDGREQVRYGGSDAIHCDAPGTNGDGTPSRGSLRYARGLLVTPLADLGRAPLNQARSVRPTTPPRGCSS